MIQSLYHKFTEHYPNYKFGYKVTDLWISLSVMDKRGAKLDKVALDSTEEQIKISWYKLLKELNPNANQASQGQ
jgi:hypothetical protein